MTIIAEMLFDLRSKGVVLWVEEKKLKYRAPQGALTAEIKSQLEQRKSEIIVFLQAQNRLNPAQSLAIPPAPQGADLPLSFSEEGIWSFEQLRPGTTAWNMQSSLRLLGTLNIPALESGLNALIRRQEVLRTAYILSAGEPRRVVTPELYLPLAIQPVACNEEMRRIMKDEANTLFDLSRAPLFRIKILRLGETEHIFVFTSHHIITDAWSTKLFFNELFALYDMIAGGRASVQSDLPIQYSDYAFWVRHLETLEAHFSYWKAQLEDLTVVQLPSDYPRPANLSFHGSRQRIALPQSLVSAIRKLCKQEKTTTFMLLLATFTVLFCRYTEKSDIIVGSTAAGRNRSELEHLIGMFINLLPLRINLAGDPSFREFLRRVREVCLDAYQHQDYPFEKLVQQLRPARDASQNPFFQVLFNVVNLPSLANQVNGLTIEPMARAEDTARFDLTLFAPETREEIQIIASYNHDLFSSGRITAMLEQAKHLLEQAVENPDRQIDDYSLVAESAKSILPDPTVTLDDAWRGAVHEIFARNAQRAPDKLAIEEPHEAWSYRELNNRSNQLAQHLLATGLAREDIVAIYGHRCAALVWALLGVLKAGAAFCIIDPSHPAARVKEYLRATAPKIFIQVGGAREPNPEMRETLNGFSRDRRIALPRVVGTRALQFLSPYSTEDPAVNVSPDDLAYVIFTSGSTGKPKGVMGRHGPLTHFLPWLRDTFELSENDRFSQLAGLSSNILQREIFTAFSLGATLCIPSSDSVANLSGVDEWLRETKVSVVHLTPAMIQVLEASSPQTIPSVRRVFFAGDLLRMRDVDTARRLMPNADVVNFYNSSETQRAGGYKTFRREEATTYKDVPPLGGGIRDVQLLVLDRNRKLAGVGELGEIYVRSPHLARGYLGDDELTKDRFIANPFAGDNADRMYRTGEFGRFMPDGSVEFAARGQDQASIRGYRIELGEIETALSRHPGIHQATVAVREDSAGDNRLVGYVVTKSDGAATASDLRGYLKQTLPEYMIPATFIFLPQLPLSTNGKVDRRALPPPGNTRPDLPETFVAPRTPMEILIAKTWTDVLGLDRVGLYDNFFDLGGHSLLSIQAIARIKEKTGVQIHPKAFVTQTVAQLASVYEEKMRRRTRALSFTQRLWRSLRNAMFHQKNTGS